MTDGGTRGTRPGRRASRGDRELFAVALLLRAAYPHRSDDDRADPYAPPVRVLVAAWNAAVTS
jgi:hypothetical protein